MARVRDQSFLQDPVSDSPTVGKQGGNSSLCNGVYSFWVGTVGIN